MSVCELVNAPEQVGGTLPGSHGHHCMHVHVTGLKQKL